MDQLQDKLNSLGRMVLTLFASSFMPALIVLGIITIIYWIYKYGAEFSTKIQYIKTRTEYSMYHFLGVYFALFAVILFVRGDVFHIDKWKQLFEQAQVNQITQFSEVMMNMGNFEYWVIGTCLLLFVTITIYLRTWRTPRATQRRNARKEIKMLFKKTRRKPDDFVDTHTIIAGTTGSGKTSQILRMVRAVLQKDRSMVIVDGKGDMSDFSIYDVVSKLAKIFNRPLYIINQTDIGNTDSYNPFKDANATQVKDMMISMGNWSDNATFYKEEAGRYWQQMAQYMIENLIPLNFENLIKFSSPSDWVEHIMTNGVLDDEHDRTVSVDTRKLIVERFGTDGLSKKRVKYLRVILQSGQNMEQAISSFANVYEGEGKRLFSGNNEFKMSDVFDANGIAIVLLNRMSYGEFAEGLGRLVIKDIKHALGDKMINKNKSKIVTLFEEVGVYFDTELVDVSARIRSLGGCVYYSMQGLSDLDYINPIVRQQIVNNTNCFITFRQNNPDDAVNFADIIGTEEVVNTTSQVEDMGTTYQGTGVGTNKVTREYRFNPELIKLLPVRRGIWWNKAEMYQRPFIFNVDFVDVGDVSIPTKAEREQRNINGTW